MQGRDGAIKLDDSQSLGIRPSRVAPYRDSRGGNTATCLHLAPEHSVLPEPGGIIQTAGPAGRLALA